jgi:hypothetical protein
MMSLRFARSLGVGTLLGLVPLLTATAALPAEPVPSRAAARPTAEQEGQALAEELLAQRPALKTTGFLRRRDSEGKWLPAVPIRFEVIDTGSDWQSIYQVPDSPSGPAETLVISQSPTRPNRYDFSRASSPGANSTTRPLSGDEASIPFADSDFWLCDLGLDFLHWPQQRIAKTEMRKGRSCRVLESVNPHARPGAYAKVLSWIDIEKRGLLRAEAYGADGKLIKEFSIGSFKKVNGRWQLKSLEIRNERTDTRTRLEFDLEVTD